MRSFLFVAKTVEQDIGAGLGKGARDAQPDAAAMERHLKVARSYDGRTLRCHGVIKP